MTPIMGRDWRSNAPHCVLTLFLPWMEYFVSRTNFLSKTDVSRTLSTKGYFRYFQHAHHTSGIIIKSEGTLFSAHQRHQIQSEEPIYFISDIFLNMVQDWMTNAQFFALKSNNLCQNLTSTLDTPIWCVSFSYSCLFFIIISSVVLNDREWQS